MQTYVTNQVRMHTPSSGREGMETLARAGYATKGAVYVLLGVLAVQAAFGSGAAQGGKGAIQQIGSQPFGAFLLIATAAGLAGYALWRGVQATVDPEHAGADAKGLGKRVGYALSGLSHTALAVMAVQLVTSGGDGGGNRKTFLADMMSNTFGQVAVGLLGVFVVGAGIHQLYKAKTTKFAREMKTGEMSQTIRKAAIWSGRFGLAARGVVFPIIGVYLVKAALNANAYQAKGVGGALREIGSNPFGTIMLAIVAAGLVAYGVYQIVLARYRKIPAP